MNILIIMPEDGMAEEFESLLKEDPAVNIITTDSEDEGFKYLCSGEFKISAVLEDLPMARQNSFSLINKINADPIFASIPVIAISENAVTEEDADCFEQGFSDILTPPGISRHVIKRINNAIDAKDSLSFSEIERMLKELPSNIYLKDAKGKYVFATHYWHHLNQAGDPGWTIRGKTDYEIRKDKANAIRAMESDKKIIETGEGTSYVIEENDDGIQEFLQLIKRPLFDENGKVTGIIALINDVTEIELLKKELEERTKTDPLTHLLNKSATEELISMLVRNQSGRGGNNKTCALLMIDVDKFKMVNDIFGHMVGDHVLALIGRLIRESFKGMDVAGRIGGDEFMVYLRDVGSAENAGILANLLNENVKKNFEGEEIEGYVSLSIGISVFPDHGKSFEELYHAADIALYHVKENGRDSFHIFDGSEKKE
ncbi:MAG: diguanylate cyclase [Lachnospiraceae bacterium]|nr:diguanylate cyclase [Lachnospiraceae bacterium]